jgi:DNA-binding NarL/FixJ family response regulator
MPRDGVVVTCVLGCFAPVLERGVVDVLRDDRQFRVLEGGLGCGALERAVQQHAPRVAILGEVADQSLLAGLRSGQPSTEILVFEHDPTPARGMRLLAAEATCVAWNVSAEELLMALRLVARGERLFISGQGHRLERRYPSELPDLTPRETDVLRLLSRGRSDGEIARDLQIGVRTVHTYTAQVRRKLKVRRKRELIGMPVPRVEDRG